MPRTAQYTQFPNDLLEALYSGGFNGTEFAILLFFTRKTEGWHKLSDKISQSQMIKKTGRCESGIKKALKRLKERSVLTKVFDHNGRTATVWKINDCVDEWQPIEGHKKNPLQNQQIGSRKQPSTGAKKAPKTAKTDTTNSRGLQKQPSGGHESNPLRVFRGSQKDPHKRKKRKEILLKERPTTCALSKQIKTILSQTLQKDVSLSAEDHQVIGDIRQQFKRYPLNAFVSSFRNFLGTCETINADTAVIGWSQNAGKYMPDIKTEKGFKKANWEEFAK